MVNIMQITEKNWNWSDEEGNHLGGQSIGESYTIAWQRGPLKESGRNGAFLLEVLQSLMDASVSWRGPSLLKTELITEPIVVTGLGFTVYFSAQKEERILVLASALISCIDQISYFQKQPRFACKENEIAIGNLIAASRALPDLYTMTDRLGIAIQALIDRRDRRDNDGTLGTHLPEIQDISILKRVLT